VFVVPRRHPIHGKRERGLHLAGKWEAINEAWRLVLAISLFRNAGKVKGKPAEESRPLTTLFACGELTGLIAAVALSLKHKNG